MNWNTNLYDQKHDFVSKYGEDVIALLNPVEGEDILDVGCGTGDLAALIAKQGATIIGIDSSKEMVEAAKQKYPHLHFEIMPAEDFSFEKKFDAVFSNATLHWVLEKEKAAQCIYNCLKPGGRLVAEFGGKGNVGKIIDALRTVLTDKGYPHAAAKKLWYFPSLSEYTGLLEKIGFRVTFASHFDRETPLKDNNGIGNWLQMFAKAYLLEVNSDAIPSIIKEVETKLKATNFKNGQWFADYVRLRIVAIKSS